MPIIVCKRAWLLSLLGGALLASQVTQAAPMWPDCSNVSTNFAVNSTGGDFVADGCKFPNQFVNVTFPDALPIDASASVVVSNGWVGPGNNTGIGLVGPAFEVAPLMGPLTISITAMHFGTDAIIRFTGALPPKSSLAISSNNFSLTQTNANAFSALAAAITLGDSHRALALVDGSRISVTHNSVQATTSVNLAGIDLRFGNITVTGGSALIVDGNSLDSSSVTPAVYSASVVRWSLTSPTVNGSYPDTFAPLTIADRSVISMNNNAIRNLTCVSNFFQQSLSVNVISIFFGFSSISIPLTVTDSSALLINGNTITNSSTSSGFNFDANYAVYVINWVINSAVGNMVIDNNSTVTMNDNFLGNGTRFDTGYVVNWMVSGAMTGGLNLTRQSSIVIQRNGIANAMNTPLGSQKGHGYVVFLSISFLTYFTVADGSAVILTGNNIINVTSNGVMNVINWYTFDFSLTNASVFNASANSIANSAIQYPGVVTAQFTYTNLLVSGGSSFLVSLNVLANSTAGAQADIAHVMFNNAANVSLTGNSVIEMSGNGVVSSTLGLTCQVATLTFYTYVALNISVGCHLSFDGNFIQSTSVANSATVVLCETQSVTSGASYIAGGSILMTNNIINASTMLTSLSLCNFNWNSAIYLTNGAIFATNMNSVQASTTSGSVYLVNWAASGAPGTGITVADFSTVSIDANRIVGTFVSGQLTAVYWNLVNVVITQNSSVTISHTAMEASNATQANLVWFQIQTLDLSNSGTFAVSGNVITLPNSQPASSGGIVYINGALVLANASFAVIDNTVQAPTPVSSYLIVSTSTFVESGASSIQLSNQISWDNNANTQPCSYLQPTSLAHAVSSACQLAPTNAPFNNNDGNTKGVIAGAVIGSIVGVALIVGGALFLRRRRAASSLDSPPLMTQEKPAYGMNQ